MAPTIEFIERAFQDAREGRAGAGAVQRRRHPDHPRHDAEPRRHAHHVAVHAVGAGRLERRAAHRGARGLRRPAHRPLRRRSRPNFKSSITAPRHRRTARDGAGVRPDRRQHLPRRALARAAVPHAPGPGYADYRTPIAGLYNASSATHAGGGVCGIPGWQAAEAAIEGPQAQPQRVRQRSRDGPCDRASIATRPTPSRRCCGALGRASSAPAPRPGSFGARMVNEVLRGPGDRRSTWSTRATTRSPVSPCLPSLHAPRRAGRPGAARRRRRRAGRPAARGRRDRARSAVVFGSAHGAGAAGRRCATSPPTPGWPCAAPAAWAS